MTPRCPTCGATFRGGTECGRCGTDLRGPAAVVRAAWRAREEARRALAEGDGEAALRHADRSLALHRTERGLRLRALALISAGRLREGVRLAAGALPEQESGKE